MFHVEHYSLVENHQPYTVVTHGAFPPVILHQQPYTFPEMGKPVPCRNHVGAGDCFGAHLALALASDVHNLRAAVRYAHAAGRVYVQHPHNRPPYLHEIARDLDPVQGKVINRGYPASDPLRLKLRKSIPGRIVFTNGVFRVPHAGHSWLLRWAKQQGDVLVVGVNDDDSARRLRPHQPFLPLTERLEVLAGLECVDWIIPFHEDTPVAILDALKADVLVKGFEYQGQQVPGSDRVKEVLFAPESPYPAHSTDVIRHLCGITGA
jgi:D-beta-D-heptose 7-phosphate kinase/D-beta-D-heptose 1-phosphate adenosyltransferase